MQAAKDWQTWVLHLSYMFSFGVELIVNANIVLYFIDNWEMTQFEASTFGALFGLLNLVCRTIGGHWSGMLIVACAFELNLIVCLSLTTLLRGFVQKQTTSMPSLAFAVASGPCGSRLSVWVYA